MKFYSVLLGVCFITFSCDTGTQSNHSLGTNEAKMAIVIAEKNLLMGGPYRVKQTITFNNIEINHESEVIPPNRTRVKSGTGDKTEERIFTRDRCWIKSGNKWKETEFPELRRLMESESFLKEMREAKEDFRKLEETLLNGVTTNVYSYTWDFAKTPSFGFPGKSIITLWIGVDDLRVYKQVSEGISAGVKNYSVEHFTYDPNIKINIPDE